MNSSLVAALVCAFVFAAADPSQSQTLEKIDKAGTLVIGTRTGSPPFAFVNKNNEWVGFSIELVERTVLPVLSRRGPWCGRGGCR